MNSYPAALMMLIPFVIWIGALVFMVTMVWRLVRGVERIANALERK